MKIRALRNFLANNFALSDAEARAKFLGSDELFRFISMCKFVSFKNLVAMITSLSELCLRFRRFILLAKTKKVSFYELWQHHKQLRTMEINEA